MNETATIDHRVWVGPHGLFYEGALPELDWHTHSFACLLMTRGRPFEIETRTEPAREVSVALAPGGVEHRLRFTEDPMLTWYLAPHEPEFPVVSGARLDAPGVLERPHALDDAMSEWDTERSSRALRAWLTQTWGHPGSFHDRRVQRVLEGLWRGEGLLEGPGELAQGQGMSASRLSHLLKENTGSTLRALQRGYRFWFAGRAMVGGVTFTAAAYEAMFADGAHLSRAFRRAYGLAPTKLLASPTLWDICEMSEPLTPKLL